MSNTDKIHQLEKKLQICYMVIFILGIMALIAICTWIRICRVCKRWERLERRRYARGQESSIELLQMGQRASTQQTSDNRNTTTSHMNQSSSTAKSSELPKPILKSPCAKKTEDASQSMKWDPATGAPKSKALSFASGSPKGTSLMFERDPTC